jgi:hypothetical protein
VGAVTIATPVGNRDIAERRVRGSIGLGAGSVAAMAGVGSMMPPA